MKSTSPSTYSGTGNGEHRAVVFRQTRSCIQILSKPAIRSELLVDQKIDGHCGQPALHLFSRLLSLIVISLIVKLTSKGPVLFRQARVGQYGRQFTFLKFRSMYFKNDHTIHQEYVKRWIAGTTDLERENGRKPEVYKLTDDPRITPFRKILAKD
jgi:lipopolysaccharide/colanic/teichoic acid biosynthesis glycosyltransferase